MNDRLMSYEEWWREPGVYGSYDDYCRGVSALFEYFEKERMKRALREVLEERDRRSAKLSNI